MTNDLISIIMPVWNPNVEQFKLAIESIISQTYSNLELLIIYKKKTKELDDQIMKVIGEIDDSRIKLVYNNNNFVDALNEGILKSSGQIIGRMDADDISIKTRFEEQIKYQNENNLPILGSWVKSISSNGDSIGTIEPPYLPNDIRKKIIYHSPLSHSSIIIKKDIFKKIGLYDPKFLGAEDYELYLRAISKGFELGNIPKYLIYIREEETSYMRGKGWKKSRKAYFNAKTKAVKEYKFNRFTDIIFWLLTPITFFVPPKLAYLMKNTIGWYKTN